MLSSILYDVKEAARRQSPERVRGIEKYKGKGVFKIEGSKCKVEG